MAKVDTEKLNELTGHIMSSDKLAAQNDKRQIWMQLHGPAGTYMIDLVGTEGRPTFIKSESTVN